MSIETVIRETVEQAIGDKIDTAFRSFFHSMRNEPKTAWPDDKLLNEREASEVLSIPVNTLRNWRSGKANLRFVTVGEKSVRYRWGDLKEYIRMNTVRAVDSDGRVI